MAISSSSLPGVHLPVRSISLPSREHPSSIRLEALLNHLKSCQASLVSNNPFLFAPETIQASLLGLAELYTCMEEFISFPATQQALVPNRVEEALDGSITLLDTCNMARDMLLTMNEHVQILQSALRRKGRDHSNIETSIHAYISYRKKAKKEIAKCQAALKHMDRSTISTSSSPILDPDHQPSMAVRVLKESSTVTISILRALLELFSGSSTKSTKGGWSLISKLMPMRLSSSCEKGQRIGNLVGSVDFAFCSLLGNIQSNDIRAEVQMAQRTLETLSLTSEVLVAGLDSMFRCLVQHRVSLLNILTQ